MNFPSLDKRGIDPDVPFRVKTPKFFIIFMLFNFWFSCFYCKKEPLWCRLNDVLVYGYNSKSLRVVLTLCLFSRVLVDSPQRPMTYPITVLFYFVLFYFLFVLFCFVSLCYSVSYGVYLVEKALKLGQKWLATSQNSHLGEIGDYLSSLVVCLAPSSTEKVS